MNDYFKMFLIALVTSVAAQLLLTPYIVKLQGLGNTSAPAPANAPAAPATEAAPEASEKLSAPNLEGMTVDAARERWRAKGLVIIEDGERSVAEAEPGTIVQQRPSAGAELSSNKEIRVVVAKASSDIAIPKVEGKSYDDARTALVAAGFEVPEPAKEVSEDAAGTVLKQVPGSGTKAKEGSVVRLTPRCAVCTSRAPRRSSRSRASPPGKSAASRTPSAARTTCSVSRPARVTRSRRGPKSS